MTKGFNFREDVKERVGREIDAIAKERGLSRVEVLSIAVRVLSTAPTKEQSE